MPVIESAGFPPLSLGARSCHQCAVRGRRCGHVFRWEADEPKQRSYTADVVAAFIGVGAQRRSVLWRTGDGRGHARFVTVPHPARPATLAFLAKIGHTVRE